MGLKYIFVLVNIIATIDKVIEGGENKCQK